MPRYRRNGPVLVRHGGQVYRVHHWECDPIAGAYRLYYENTANGFAYACDSPAVDPESIRAAVRKDLNAQAAALRPVKRKLIPGKLLNPENVEE